LKGIGVKMYEKILIADDEEGIVSFIKDALFSEGYEVWTAYDDDQAIKYALKQPDLILLDIMMPGKDGFLVCKDIRDLVACPIVFLSALQSEADKIKGLALGGDDYLIKPFSLRELKMRIKAHLRREERAAIIDKRNYIKYGNLSINLQGREIFLGNEPLLFTPHEFDIIELLALHPGMIFSKEQIYEKVWGYDAVGDSAVVTEHIKKIRAKFSHSEEKSMFITTVWGVGYKWERPK
jgi:DNA-binding response OmpR family regulator